MAFTRQRASIELNENNRDKIGTYVWCLFNKNYWPAIVVSHKDVCFKEPKPNKLWLFWFGDYRVSEIEQKFISPFNVDFARIYNKQFSKMNLKWKTGVMEAIRECGSQKTLCLNDKELLEWAINGFEGRSSQSSCMSQFVSEKLQKIKNKNKKPVDPNSERKLGASSETKALLREIRKGSRSLDSICLGCYSLNVVDEHPVFHGSVCCSCKIKIKNTYYVIGEDNIKYFCTICASPGNMIVCESEGCGKVYCKICIDELTIAGFKGEILKENPWFCFVCKENNCGLLTARVDWSNRIHSLFVNTDSGHPSPVRREIPTQKRPIRVLSLFDGIAAGYTALEKLGIVVECYFACEIEDDSLKVVKKNYGDKVTPLGDVLNLSESDIKKLVPIDLLIGGSPCNDLSLVNPYRKGLYDPNGTGILFFEYYRILSTLRENNGKPFDWMYENVASMQHQYKNVISRFLQCEPTVIDAAWVSPQRRHRYYWSNLPTLQDQMYENEGPDLQNFLMPERFATVKKLRTVTTRSNSLRQGPNMDYPVRSRINSEDTVNITELEEIFGFPRHYTEVEGLSVTMRQKLLGMSWSVQVICVILRCLRDHFQTK